MLIFEGFCCWPGEKLGVPQENRQNSWQMILSVTDMNTFTNFLHTGQKPMDFCHVNTKR